MKPTKEQLKDPKWWDENAPEGYDFFILDKDNEEKARFHRLIEGFYYDEQGCYWRDIDEDYLEVHTRPEPEWQPKVGDVCLARRFGSKWMEAELLKYVPDGLSVFYGLVDGSQFVFLSKDFKPLPTKKDEFIKAAQRAIDRDGDIDLAALYDLAMEFK